MKRTDKITTMHTREEIKRKTKKERKKERQEEREEREKRTIHLRLESFSEN